MIEVFITNANQKKDELSRENLLFNNNNFLNQIALTDSINNFKAFVNLTKAGMFAVEVRSLAAAMANKKL